MEINREARPGGYEGTSRNGPHGPSPGDALPGLMMAGQKYIRQRRREMSREVEIVGSVPNACRNWHLAAGTIVSARFGVKLTPKPRPSKDGPEGAKPRPSA